LYPHYQSILTGLTRSKYGKGYIHCLKYRIIAAVEKEVGEKCHDIIVEWTQEWGNTWRNTALRCSRGAAALATLGQRASSSVLTPQLSEIYQILQVLFTGPIVLLPFPLSIPTDIAHLSAQQWQKLRVERRAVSLKSNMIEDFVRAVDASPP
jgi:hypothetical protein